MFCTTPRPAIVKEEIIPPKCGPSPNPLVFLLHNVLTKEECENFIQETERRGYEEALLNIGGGQQVKKRDVRNSSRCIIDSQEYVDELWTRIKDFLPSGFKDKKVLGMNERLRFLRYDPGEYFKPHFDGVYVRENGDKSAITFQLYLNEGFEGGATTFLGLYNQEEKFPVIPKTGSALIFEHKLLHEGSVLVKGRKYTVRTDIMVSGS